MLDSIWDRWSFLILQTSFNGTCYFEDYLAQLGAARNILSNRLGRLVSHGLLLRRPCVIDRRRIEYRLSEKGIGIFPVLAAFCYWNKRFSDKSQCHIEALDRSTGMPVARVAFYAEDGGELTPSDIVLRISMDEQPDLCPAE
ncbi:MAG: winged helix-turn-helix transcriptional regulator [Sphingomonadaceae bacterium]